jgi:two-component system sensor histidine kinase DegS
VERQTGIRLHYEKSGQSFSVDTSAGVHLYRIIQEALNNVSRHAGVPEAWIRLKFLPHALELEVEDHGKGFVSQNTSNGDTPRGIGLVGMRERAELIGAILEISHPAEGGTLIRVKIPQDKLQTHAA